MPSPKIANKTEFSSLDRVHISPGLLVFSNVAFVRLRLAFLSLPRKGESWKRQSNLVRGNGEIGVDPRLTACSQKIRAFVVEIRGSA